MIVTKSRTDAERSSGRYTTADGLETSYTSYFGVTIVEGAASHPPVGELFPVAFRVDQDPETRADPHFHRANQFQLFVHGDGEFGKHPVRAFSVHYAGAYTPYGPICAGRDGIGYMTLRNGWDDGPHYMPAKRELLQSGKRKPRAALSETIDPPDSAVLLALTAPSCRTVLPLEADGLGAWHYRIPPHGSAVGPDPATGGGQYWIVLGGDDANGGASLPSLSCLFLSADERARVATAGPHGLDVLALQFPH